jgi:GT2 family glycosyltransferase
MQEFPELAEAMDLLIVDNTPQAQIVPAEYAGRYLHDGLNPGLAERYHYALGLAATEGFDWLMLLDHDTVVTSEYLAEVWARVGSVGPDVVALVPRLTERGVVCSPAEPPALGPPRAWQAEGPASARLIAFNSGAVLRVSAMLAIGGFSKEFPLDYLDHATFAALQDKGGLVYVLGAALEHELSSNTERKGAAAVQRQEAVLAAERRFYARYGTLGQRWLRRVRLLKAAAGRIVRGREGGQTWRMIKSALRP